MVSVRSRDPLLAASSLLCSVFTLALAFIAVALPLAACALALFHEDLARELEEPAVLDAALRALLVVLLGGLAVLAAMGAAFFLMLRRVIRSVGEGEAFSLANAGRLQTMGWLALTGQAVAIPLGRVADEISARVHDTEIDGLGLSLTGILLALVLFILARLFREGAAMRADLEGTV